MRSRFLHAIAGMIILAAVDLLVNLLAAAIGQQSFATQLSSTSSITLLMVLIIVGLLLGYWLGGEVQLPAPPPQPLRPPESGDYLNTTSITRLSALLSFGKLSGQGIHLSDILLVGSRLDIDAKK